MLEYSRIEMCIDGWRSILDGHGASEDGPKNPSKGTSMKSLVVALDAQLGVAAGGYGGGAACKGMQVLTLAPRRLKIVGNRKPVQMGNYGLGDEPASSVRGAGRHRVLGAV